MIIIDTPGFNDTGVDRTDDDSFEAIRLYITDEEKIDRIHAVCFVGISSLARLTPS